MWPRDIWATASKRPRTDLKEDSLPYAPIITRLLMWPDRHPRLRRSAIVLASASLLLAAMDPWYTLAVRDDESLPQYSFFLIKKGAVPGRGDYVAFQMTDEYANRFQPNGALRPYARVGKLWVKRAYGAAGDAIAVQDRTIVINGESIATALERDRYEQPMVTASFTSPIPAGLYYLGLPHPRSFDSKYIGLVSLKDIQGVVYPLF